MDIVVSFDKNYVMPAGVMLTSLFENNKGATIHIHALLKGDHGFAQPIFDIVRKYKGTLSCYDMSNYCLPSLPLNLPNQRANIPVESYYRLFLPNLLATGIEKVLWLDCDMIVTDNIDGLWNEDISDYGLGVVPDFENNNVHIMNRLGYDAVYGYFNAGVLLINLAYWRDNNVIQSFLDYIGSHFYELHYHDQDILNYVFHKSKKVLSLRYNFQTTFLYKKKFRNFSCVFFPQVDQFFKAPCIIHFTDFKPWFNNTINPMRDVFIKYQNMTIWKGIVMKKKNSLKQRIMDLVICLKYKEKSLKGVFYDSQYL